MLALLMLASRAEAIRAMFEGPPPSGREAFIVWLAPKAREMQRRLGIPASAAIAQAMYEALTPSGEPSFLAREAKNLYGMTAAGTGAGNPFWDGRRVFRGDREWRVYRSYSDSVMDYGHLFYRVAAYHPALAYLDNPAAFLAHIVPIYAPASDGNAGYLSAVVGLIERFNLTQYDVPRAEWALDPNLTGGRVIA
mgnify:CR=1 FL=1